MVHGDTTSLLAVTATPFTTHALVGGGSLDNAASLPTSRLSMLRQAKTAGKINYQDLGGSTYFSLCCNSVSPYFSLCYFCIVALLTFLYLLVL